MLERLRKLLQSAEIKQWRALFKKKYILNSKTEKETQVIRCSIYIPFFSEGRKYLGRGNFEFSPDSTDEEIKNLIESEKKEALNTFDPWFPLENNQGITTQKQVSSLGKMDFQGLMTSFKELAAKVFREFGLDSDTIEFSIKKTETIYWDFSGRELVNLSYSADANFTLLPGRHFRFSEYLPQVLENTLKSWAMEVEDSKKAVAFNGKKLPVLLSGRMVKEVFSYLLRQCTGLALYSGLSNLEPGKLLWDIPVMGDRISMKVISNLYNSPFTRFFDDQGKILNNVDVILENRFNHAITTQETAHYLGLPWSGHLTNFSITPGTLDMTRFQKEPCLEVFSGYMDVDDKTGNFVIESDLAYQFDGPQKVPVTGVVLKGNLQDLLLNMRLSKEIYLLESYEGPEYILVSDDFIKEV